MVDIADVLNLKSVQVCVAINKHTVKLSASDVGHTETDAGVGGDFAAQVEALQIWEGVSIHAPTPASMAASSTKPATVHSIIFVTFLTIPV